MSVFIEIAYFDEQDYAWVKRGMIFPFVDYVDRCVLLAFARCKVIILNYFVHGSNVL